MGNLKFIILRDSRSASTGEEPKPSKPFSVVKILVMKPKSFEMYTIARAYPQSLLHFVN